MLAISRILIVLLLGVLFFICGLCSAAEFQPNDASLKQYKCPEWFRDIKFGIWAQWGPQAVPMDSDW
jgi:hypothetical protein